MGFGMVWGLGHTGLGFKAQSLTGGILLMLRITRFRVEGFRISGGGFRV